MATREAPGRARATWKIGNLEKKSKPDGSAAARVPVLDGDVVQGHVTFELSPGRDLLVIYEVLEGAEPPAGFQAWIRGEVTAASRGV